MIDEAAGGIIYVGFTEEPIASLEKLRRHLIAPDRFLPFPVAPRYTGEELEKIWEAFPSPKSPLWKVVNGTSIHYITNKIEVGTQHVGRVCRLITNLYGPEAPFEVVYAMPAILLQSKEASMWPPGRDARRRSRFRRLLCSHCARENVQP